MKQLAISSWSLKIWDAIDYYYLQSSAITEWSRLKKLLEASSPNSISKQGELRSQNRLLRALSSWVLKTLENRDCTVLASCNNLVGTRKHHYCSVCQMKAETEVKQRYSFPLYQLFSSYNVRKWVTLKVLWVLYICSHFICLTASRKVIYYNRTFPSLWKEAVNYSQFNLLWCYLNFTQYIPQAKLSPEQMYIRIGILGPIKRKNYRETWYLTIHSIFLITCNRKND